MLEQFSIYNYLSFKDKVTVTFVPESISELTENLLKAEYLKYELLKGIGFFGLNSAGKSNLIKAIKLTKAFILGEIGGLSREKIETVLPFMLDVNTQTLPSEFEYVIWCDKKRYRYKFKINERKVIQESLQVVENKKEKLIFLRQENLYDIGREYKKEIEIYSGKVAFNELFLTFCARVSVSFGLEIANWFKNVTILQDYDAKELASSTLELIEKESFYKVNLENIIRDSSFGIECIKLTKSGGTTFLSTGHKIMKSEELFWFDLIKNESLGTIKYFGLLGPIIKTLYKGGLLVIDEIDSGFHPQLGVHLLNLFLKHNNRNFTSQMIFSSHNHEIWVKNVLRRDQQYHIIKNMETGESVLKRTYDYKIRKSKSVKRSYDDGELAQRLDVRQGNLFLDM